MEDKQILMQFANLILQYNLSVNIVSRKMSLAQLNDLIAESEMLGRFIQTDTIIDAGSGNGILGIPLAILMPQKKIYLVEPAPKKCKFLDFALSELNIKNAHLVCKSAQEFFQKANYGKSTIIARGFPDYQILAKQLKNKQYCRLAIITSENKLKKLSEGMEKYKQTIYNIPGRHLLKIMTMEIVSRET